MQLSQHQSTSHRPSRSKTPPPATRTLPPRRPARTVYYVHFHLPSIDGNTPCPSHATARCLCVEVAGTASPSAAAAAIRKAALKYPSGIQWQTTTEQQLLEAIDQQTCENESNEVAPSPAGQILDILYREDC